MPDFEAAANTIRDRFDTQMSSRSPSVTTFYDNQQGTPPNDETWVRLTVREGTALVAGFGGGTNKYRHPGNAIAQVFAPIGEGDGTARALADDIASWFRGQRLSGVRFFDAPYVNPVGPDGAWWQINVVLPFEYDLNV